MRELWQFWETGLQDHQVDTINNAAANLPVSNAGVGFAGEGNSSGVRTSDVRWINPNMSENRPIVDMLWYFANEANKNAFGFDISYLPDIQHTTYNGTDGGHYDWHCDTFWANPSSFDRKISIVIQLSDPSEYEGGIFEIDPQYPQLPQDIISKKGAVIVFPSFLRHRVTPVTSGTRRSLVSWIQGPKFR